MTRSEIRTFIEDGAKLITPQVSFGEGRRSEVHTMNNEAQDVIVWRMTTTGEEAGSQITQGQGNPFDSWPIQVYVLKKDRLDSKPSEYEELIDDCDLIAKKLIAKYQITVTNWDLVMIEDIGRAPIIKQFDVPLTGVLLTFTITSPDKTDVC